MNEIGPSRSNLQPPVLLIGTLLVALIDILWFKEQVTVVRCVSTFLIVIGVAGLYLTGSHQ